MFNNDKKSIITINIISIILIIFIAPFLSFWIGYFIGWISKITVGDTLVSGLNIIHISITKEQLPLCGGALAWISSFFINKNIKYDE